MHISPTTAAIIHAILNAAIFLTLYFFVRKAIVSQTKAKALKALLDKCQSIESEIKAETKAKDRGELGHYARIRNEKRVYAIEQLAEFAKDISNA